MLMRDRLIELFKWRKGKVAFSENAKERESKPVAQSLLHMLFDGVHRCWTQKELHEKLAHNLDRRWNASNNFNNVLSLMDLNDGQKNAAQRLVDGRSANQIVKKSPADTMVTLVMMYLLTEMDLLVERRA